MIENDPIMKIEKIVREVHDGAGKYTHPVLSRYPLLFAFLLTFSVAAISHGFEILSDDVAFFHEHPWSLMTIGIVALILTGTLYKSLKKMG